MERGISVDQYAIGVITTNEGTKERTKGLRRGKLESLGGASPDVDVVLFFGTKPLSCGSGLWRTTFLEFDDTQVRSILDRIWTLGSVEMGGNPIWLVYCVGTNAWDSTWN